jgi:hypothetical protein
MSVGSYVPSNICSALHVSAPNPVFLITSGFANGVNSACLKCRMFRCSISLSIVGISVIAKYSISIPSYGNGTKIDDMPPLGNSFLMVILTSFVSCPMLFGISVLLFLHLFLGSLLHMLLPVFHLLMFSLLFFR